MEIGERLRELMNEKSLRAGKLAKMAEISGPYMSNLLHGDRSPSALILDRIARALGVTVDDILHPHIQKLRKPEKEYITGCIRCGSASDLCMIPHGREGQLNGWVFACDRCSNWILGGTVKFTDTKTQFPERGEDNIEEEQSGDTQQPCEAEGCERQGEGEGRL